MFLLYLSQESLNLEDNLHYIQQCAHYLLDSMDELLKSAPSNECKLQVANAIAFIGQLLYDNDERCLFNRIPICNVLFVQNY